VPERVNDDWEDALATGNGRQGALCWGGPDEVRVTVSHERLFLPLHPPLDPPDTSRILPGLRGLLDAGRYADAARAVCDAAVAEEPAYADTVWIDPLVGAATLRIRADRHGPARDFRRSVDLATGVVTLGWQDDRGEVRVTAFASRPADAVVIRLSGFTGTVQLTPIDGTPPRPFSSDVDAESGGLTLTGRFDGATWPGALTGYRVDCRVTPAATVTAAGTLAIEGDTVLILRTTPSPCVPPSRDLGGVFEAMLAEHTAAHGELFHRVRLDLGADPADRVRPDLPVGPALIERLFDAGRYLIISSTGALPPTLQGVWSGTWTPPWSSGYTLDGNLPAAVAALLPTRTPELLLPLFDLVDSVRDDLRDNARRLYGARGLLTPVHLSTHGRQNHFGPVWCQTFWTAGAGWLARLYVDYCRYTGDRAFLRDRAWPFLREAADFLLDFARIRDGAAVFAPSYSPENAPASTGSQAAVNATMDVAVARDLLRNLLAVAAELGRPEPDGARALLDALPGYRIADGRLAEWIHPDLADQPAHRHASHLWPLWYEPDPLITDDPAMRAAAIGAVRDRLAWWASAESDEMAYGLVQLGLAAAALGLADEAWTTLRWMAGRYWGTNLVPRHNRGAIFNVDIAGGFPAVVAAMLVRSAHGRLDLLPARPDDWPRGRVTGLAARDAVTVRELWWEPGAAGVVLTAERDTPVTVTAPPRMTFADGRASWRGLLATGTPLTLSCVSRKNTSS
jgi:hypothetical protein